MTGFEPVTSSLPRKHSTPELHRLVFNKRAGDEARTRDLQLGRLSLYQLSYSRLSNIDHKGQSQWWGKKDSNLRRHKSTDLQSVPVGRFGIPPVNFLKNILLKMTYSSCLIFLRKCKIICF